MKISTLLMVVTISIFTITTNASPLSPRTTTSLFDHMVEVNKEWIVMQAPVAGLTIDADFNDDISRIQTHLQLVEHFLRESNTDHLNCSQLEKRLEMLDELRTYWQTGQFPINTGHLARQPYFIDNFGTACAVGHLLQESGFSDFAQQVRQKSNFAYIMEMQYDEIPVWAKKYGFTIAELAWIQPAYSPPTLPWSALGNGGGPDGEIHTMYHDEEAGKLYIAGDFDDMDGTTCTSIVSWDGSNWEAMGNNFDGSVHAIEKHDGKIHIAGNFQLFTGAPWGNVAVWDEQYASWQGLHIGILQGTVLTMKSFDGKLYIGGDFLNFDGQGMRYWAAFDSGMWTWDNFGIEPSGPVTQFEIVGDQLAIAGEFEQLITEVLPIDANYLVYWDGNSITWTSDGDHNAISAMRYFDEHLYLADNDAIFVKSDDNQWTSTSNFLSNELSPIPEGKIHQFQPHNDELYAVGNFYIYPDGIGLFGRNMIGLTLLSDPFYVYADGAAHFDSTVTAAASFDDKFFAGGLFENIDLNPFNHIAATDLGISTSIEEPIAENYLKVYFTNAEQAVIVQYEDLREESTFGFYDIQGRLIHTCQLEPGTMTLRIPTAKLATGAYIYQMVNSRHSESGKVMVVN
ncbi:MAG: hypothetical protein AAF502_09820 [Bacteroidota bacterium]